MTTRGAPRLRLSPERAARIRETLETVRRDCDVGASVESDPVRVVHRFTAVADQELAALLASALAFGNVRTILAKLDQVLALLGPALAEGLDDAAATRRKLKGFRHRIYTGAHVADLLLGARAVQRSEGSLGAAFSADLAREGTLRGALSAWVLRIRASTPGTPAGGRAAKHILANPEGGSASKRLMLFLRWMVRPKDGVDLGLWDVPTSLLVIPVDVHIHKLARNLGLTAASAPTWRAAEEITRSLARFDAADPVKYDFSLCHLGMEQRCRSKRDEAVCPSCDIRQVCRHWGARG